MSKTVVTRHWNKLAWLAFGVAGVLATVGCDKKAKDESKPEPPPLAQTAPQTATAATPAPPPAPQANKDKAAPISGGEELDGEEKDAAGEAEEEASDGEDAPPKSKKTASKKKTKSKTKKKTTSGTSPRQRSSTSSDSKDSSSAKAHAEGDLVLKRIQFTSKVEGREPIDPEETFSRGQIDKLYAFVELANKTKQSTKIVVVFVPPQGASSKVTLKVGESPRWRTWALRKAPKAIGTWKVIVRDESGRELGHRSFEVTE